MKLMTKDEIEEYRLRADDLFMHEYGRRFSREIQVLNDAIRRAITADANVTEVYVRVAGEFTSERLAVWRFHVIPMAEQLGYEISSEIVDADVVMHVILPKDDEP